ncbi:MAG: DUF3365 domain-containing protein [Saprospiraceae bacterium]|nr:DUF3365 domain-containing protein [Saprospiraceae bacterium]
MKKLVISGAVFSLVLLFACTSNTSESENKEGDQRELEARYLEKGIDVTAKTFKTMSGHLMQAMQEGGIANAVKFCNLNAYALVDSIARSQNVTIKRTSHKLRNKKNGPDPDEEKVIQDYLTQNEIPAPRVRIQEKSIRYFAPIHVIDNCLKCHGTFNSTLKSSDYAVIQELYPEDQAIGFEVGDLRGIWSLEFARNE